jgi:SAM-dependent methyltransferase
MNKNKLNTYLSLCTDVYDLSKPQPPEDAYQFYRSYVNQSQGSVLEPMCGTGRFLLPLLAEGFEVYGFDASEHMLARLHQKASQQNLKPNVWQGFVKDLNTQGQYKLIFIPSGSFCLITDLEAVRNALKKFYDHLNKDGILLFEVETDAGIPPLGIWRGAKWTKPDGKIIILSSYTSLEDKICSYIGKYELVDSNSIIHTEVEELKVRIYEHDELVAMLKEAGFKDVRAMKAFDQTAAPTAHDDSIVYEARK